MQASADLLCSVSSSQIGSLKLGPPLRVQPTGLSWHIRLNILVTASSCYGMQATKENQETGALTQLPPDFCLAVLTADAT